MEKIYGGISHNLREYMLQVQSTVSNNSLVVHVPDRFESDYFTIHKSAIT